MAHRVLTGHGVRVGNFSVIPRERLSCLVATSELWNHYAAAAFPSRQPYATVPTRRADRLDGRSKMNFVALVIHGLSAISVYSDAIGVRLLIATLAMIGLDLAALAADGGRPADDRPGHPRLGHDRLRRPPDHPAPGDDVPVRLQLHDPRRPERRELPAAEGLRLFRGLRAGGLPTMNAALQLRRRRTRPLRGGPELEVVLPRPDRPVPGRGRPGGRRRARRDDPRPLPGDRASMGRPGARRRPWPAGSPRRSAPGTLPACCEVRVGTLEGADPAETFDTILYMDVLEHIEDDRGRGRPGRRASPARRARHRALAGPPVAFHPIRPGHRPLSTLY